MSWTAKMGNHDIVLESKQLKAFKQMHVDGDIAARMSDLLLFDMYVLNVKFGISPHEILKSIKNLEAGEPHSGVKPATMFRNPPLKGLWPKHFFFYLIFSQMSSSRSGNGLKKLVTEVLDPLKAVITKEMIEELARRATTEQVERRHAEGKITGEWLVFAKHGGKNYYLALNTHSAGDKFIYDRIMEHCPRNFPDLQAWVSASGAAP